MAIELTTDFTSIQDRHIDPYSPVDSDNTSMLLKALCKEKCVSCGFDYTLLENDSDDDGTADGVVIALTPGTAVKDYIVIKFNDTIYLKLFDLGESLVSGDYKYVVLEYVYQKRLVVPHGEIKVILPSEYDQDKHLVLYKVRFDNDAGTDPIDITKITVFDQRFSQATSRFKYTTYLYVGASSSGFVALNPAYPLEFISIADKDYNYYRIYANEYFDDEGRITVTVNSAFAGHHMVLTALDFAVTKYESDQYCICTDPMTKIFNHNLDNTYNIVAQFVYDSDIDRWSMALPETIHFENANRLWVKNSGSITGKYAIVKVYKPDFTYDFLPGSGNDTATVTHNLLTRYPIVEVVDLTTNEIVIPEYVQYTDTNELKVYFGSSIYGHDVRIMVKKGNEYCLVPSENRTFDICHNLHERWLDWVQVINTETYYQEQPEYIKFLDEDTARIKFGDSAEGWYYVSMGLMETDRGCV